MIRSHGSVFCVTRPKLPTRDVLAVDAIIQSSLLHSATFYGPLDRGRWPSISPLWARTGPRATEALLGLRHSRVWWTDTEPVEARSKLAPFRHPDGVFHRKAYPVNYSLLRPDPLGLALLRRSSVHERVERARRDAPANRDARRAAPPAPLQSRYDIRRSS